MFHDKLNTYFKSLHQKLLLSAASLAVEHFEQYVCITPQCKQLALNIWNWRRLKNLDIKKKPLCIKEMSKKYKILGVNTYIIRILNDQLLLRVV